MKRPFISHMDNFKSNFLSQGQPGSKSIDKCFLSVLKMRLCYKYCFGNLIFALIAQTLSGNRLNMHYFINHLLEQLYVCCYQNSESCTLQMSLPPSQQYDFPH